MLLDSIGNSISSCSFFIRVLSTLELKAPCSAERLNLNTDQTYVFTFLPTVSQIFKWTFESKFLLPKTSWIFCKKNSIKNIKLDEHLLCLVFLRKPLFWTTLFSKSLPYFCWLIWKSKWQLAKKKINRVDQCSKLVF